MVTREQVNTKGAERRLNLLNQPNDLNLLNQGFSNFCKLGPPKAG